MTNLKWFCYTTLILFFAIWSSHLIILWLVPNIICKITFKTPWLNFGSVALLWRNAKRNVNPGLSYFERCSLACLHILANLHLPFTFCDLSKYHANITQPFDHCKPIRIPKSSLLLSGKCMEMKMTLQVFWESRSNLQLSTIRVTIPGRKWWASFCHFMPAQKSQFVWTQQRYKMFSIVFKTFHYTIL